MAQQWGEAEAAVVKRRADLRYERKLWLSGLQAVAGVDEAGVGPMAGPVVAAAVIFAPEIHIKGVHDSKQVPAPKREELYEIIAARALAFAIGVAEVDEIDRVNIYHATLAACVRAVESLCVKPEHVLIDASSIAAILVTVLPVTRAIARRNIWRPSPGSDLLRSIAPHSHQSAPPHSST
jgi:ribonuclease HII